jgi:hypothetical protein
MHKVLSVEGNLNRELIIEPSGVIKIKRPLLNKVDHIHTSRALHKIAFEYEINTILDDIVASAIAKRGHHNIKAAHNMALFENETGTYHPFMASEPPIIKTAEIIDAEIKLYNDPGVVERARKQMLSSEYNHIRDYVRAPHPNEYRPYGIARDGGTAVNVAPMIFNASDNPTIVGPAFNSYVIVLPGVRFVVTTAQDPKLLSYAVKQIARYGMTAWMGVSEIYWDAKGGVVSQN